MTDEEYDRAVSKTRPAMLTIAYSIIRNRDDAEDVVQDTLIEVWAYSQAHPISSLEAFLRTGTRLRALRALARKKRREEVVTMLSLDEGNDCLFTLANTWTLNDPRSTECNEIELDIGDLVKQSGITDKGRRRLWLSVCEEKSYAEVAKLEGVQWQSVQSSVNIALASLREQAKGMEVTAT